MGLGLLYWAVAGLSITAFGSLLYAILPKKYSLPCGRFILQKAFLLFIAYFKAAGLLELNDSALQSLADKKQAMIIAPNHISLWDAVFIIAKIPETMCIMKGAILKNPFLGGGARLAGYIPNDSTTQMLLAATHQAKKGEKLLLFPVFIRCNSRFYEKGWALYRKPPFPIQLSFEVGEGGDCVFCWRNCVGFYAAIGIIVFSGVGKTSSVAQKVCG